mmetsp:Transcript_10161/g.20682  ORF Transcript_10161/g.20682 Transcript_10161/m.20682 type:complete len:293 (-) Transcript_10161:59-937(-)
MSVEAERATAERIEAKENEQAAFGMPRVSADMHARHGNLHPRRALRGLLGDSVCHQRIAEHARCDDERLKKVRAKLLLELLLEAAVLTSALAGATSLRLRQLPPGHHARRSGASCARHLRGGCLHRLAAEFHVAVANDELHADRCAQPRGQALWFGRCALRYERQHDLIDAVGDEGGLLCGSLRCQRLHEAQYHPNDAERLTGEWELGKRSQASRRRQCINGRKVDGVRQAGTCVAAAQQHKEVVKLGTARWLLDLWRRAHCHGRAQTRLRLRHPQGCGHGQAGHQQHGADG